MAQHDENEYQKAQIEVIKKIEQQANSNTMQFSTVSQVGDYAHDPRIALTSVHFPNQTFLTEVQKKILDPLRKISPNHYYYPQNTLHITVKNVRVIHNPPTFTEEDVHKVKKVFEEIIPKHHSFKSYFYRLLVFPGSVALIGTADNELDQIHIDLDNALRKAGVPDDKQYLNTHNFFSNMTLARFTSPITKEYKEKINEISENLIFKPYEINSVTLLSCNAVMNYQKIIGAWKLR